MRAYSPFATGDSRPTTDEDLRPAPRSPTPARLSRLTHALIAKSLAEGLFVVALAVYFSYTSFNPYFRGSVDMADGRVVTGWVVNHAARGERVEVYLYVDGHFVSRRLADAPRPDVFKAGWSLDPYHGFVFDLPPLPPNRTYEARVYAMHADSDDPARRALQEFDAAKQFSVTADGANSSVPEAWWESGGQR
ncbi:MAG TPA: hypothetical protein VGA87_09470 [Pyrinomonadaceae bacterium]